MRRALPQPIHGGPNSLTDSTASLTAAHPSQGRKREGAATVVVELHPEGAGARVHRPGGGDGAVGRVEDTGRAWSALEPRVRAAQGSRPSRLHRRPPGRGASGHHRGTGWAPAQRPGSPIKGMSAAMGPSTRPVRVAISLSACSEEVASSTTGPGGGGRPRLWGGRPSIPAVAGRARRRRLRPPRPRRRERRRERPWARSHLSPTGDGGPAVA